MLNYYNDEKALLSSMGEEFATRHPGVAPLLGSGSIDPDVERLLEGLAFLSANLKNKIDDEFPELTNGLLRLVAPHFLRPVPAATIIQFSPTTGSATNVFIPKGSEISSVPVEGVRCIFRTSTDMTMHPLSIRGVTFTRPDIGDPELTLDISYAGNNLKDWQAGPIRIFIGGAAGKAENLFYMLCQKNISINIRNSAGREYPLAKESLSMPGFDDSNELYPFPTQAFRAHRILKEYLAFPAKFRFIELNGFEKWTDRGADKNFHLVFRFSRDNDFEDLRRARAENFVINAVEAVNLHKGWANPITLDHQKHEYRIIADFNYAQSFHLFSVDSVTGVSALGGKQQNYRCAEDFSHESDSPHYSLSMRMNPVKQIPETFLSVLYPPGQQVKRETLSIAATFTVPDLPARLNIGDIRLSTGSSPVAAKARNIIPPTRGAMPPQDNGLLWKLISLLSANYMSMHNEDSLQKVLEIFSYVCGRDEGKKQEILMQARSICKVESEQCDLIRRGLVVRGCQTIVETTGEGFESEGMLYIFAMVLDIFFGSTMRLNHFSRFTLKNRSNGSENIFLPRLGEMREF